MNRMILQTKKISKLFGDFYALKEVDYEIYSGEVNVLIGENGAGKSTLLKILSGVHQKNEGSIFLDGKEINIKSPIVADKLGINTVYQELSIVPELSITENLFLGTDLITNKFGHVNWSDLHRKAKSILKEIVGLDLNTRKKAKELGIAQQQMIEIARVVRRKGRILILDEPTAVLSQKEVEKLFEIIDKLKKQNMAIVYVSHRLEEIFEIGDRVTVLRDGNLVGNKLVSEVDMDELIKMMVGRSLEEQYPKVDFSALNHDEVLRVEGLKSPDVKDVSFSVRKGEILGFAGLVGAGRTEIARLIFGADKLEAGQIFIDNNKVKIRNTKDAVKKGIALIPENRKEQGLVLGMSILKNITIVKIRALCNKMGIVKKKEENVVVRKYVDALKIALQNICNPVTSLSGGNQQKVVVAKWMYADAKIIIFDEPTRGIDVGAKREIYHLINQLVLEGKVVIIISSEMPELIGVCSRILTVSHGEITGEFYEKDLYNQEALLKSMMMG